MSSTDSVFHLVIHSGYTSVFVGIYDRMESIGSFSLDKKVVSAFLVPSIKDFLTHHEMKLSNLTFIAVHSGPAPFTTLRVGIATANGLGFATGLPLVPVNGLQTLSMIYPEYTVLFNAFCDDIYVGKKGIVSCQNIDAFLHEESKTAQQMTYIGNGTHLHQEKIKTIMGDKAKILADYPYEASLNDIAHAAYSKWQRQQDIQKQVIPTYLKEYSAKVV